MTRFDEVARLRELVNRVPANGIESVYDAYYERGTYNEIHIDESEIAELFNAAPWLLEAAACFQPGDAERIARIVRDDLLEGCCGQCDADVAMMHRLQKAAAIMEELE